MLFQNDEALFFVVNQKMQQGPIRLHLEFFKAKFLIRTIFAVDPPREIFLPFDVSIFNGNLLLRPLLLGLASR